MQCMHWECSTLTILIFSQQLAIWCQESLSKMRIGWHCLVIHLPNSLQNMLSKLVSKAKVQQSQTIPWNQVSAICFLASMYGLVSGKWHDSILISKSGFFNKLQESMPWCTGGFWSCNILAVWWPSILFVNLYFLRILKSCWWLCSCSLEFSNVNKSVMLLSGALQKFLHNGHFMISGLPWKASKVLLPNITILVHYLSIFEPIFIGNKPWNTLVVKNCWLINISLSSIGNFWIIFIIQWINACWYVISTSWWPQWNGISLTATSLFYYTSFTITKWSKEITPTVKVHV